MESNCVEPSSGLFVHTPCFRTPRPASALLVACGHTVCHDCCALMLQPLQPSADRSQGPGVPGVPCGDAGEGRPSGQPAEELLLLLTAGMS